MDDLNIKQACNEYMEYLRSPEYNEDGIGDYENAIFEAALESVYGNEVWTEINARMK